MVDIIVVTYNAVEKLEMCIASILKHTKLSSYTLTIVDNHSTDRTTKYLKTLKPPIQIIRTKLNKGFSHGANIGIKATKNEHLVLLDDDVEVTKGWLVGLLKNFTYNNSIGLVTPKIIYPDKTIFTTGFFPKKMFGNFDNLKDLGQHNDVKECDTCPGPCWLLKRSVIKEVGKFDQKFYPSQYEDLDYCFRIRIAGYRIIYDGRIKVIHHHLLRTKGKELTNRNLFHKKWKGLADAYLIKSSKRKIALSKKEWQQLSKIN